MVTYAHDVAIIELDPLVARKLIEGYSDELSPEAKALEALYRLVMCPACGEHGTKEFDARPRGHVFADPNVLVPRALLRCSACRCLYNPHILDSGGRAMVVERGQRE